MAGVYDRYERIARERGKERERAPETGSLRPTRRGRDSAGRVDTKTPDSVEKMAATLAKIRAERAAAAPTVAPALAIAEAVRRVATAVTPQAAVKAGQGGAARMMQAISAGGRAADPMAQFNEWQSMLPPIDRSVYVAPYEQAEGSARQAYEAAVPAIQQAYAQLKADLQSGKADLTQQNAAILQSLKDRLGSEDARTNALVDPSIDALVNQGVDPRMVAQAEQTQGALQQAGAQNNDLQVNLQDRLAQIAAQGSDRDIRDAGAGEAAALSTAQNNLSQILGQLGIKKAGAEQQFQADKAQRDLDIFNAKNKYEGDLRTQEREEAERAAEAQIKEREMRLKEEANAPTRAQAFQKAWPEISAKYKKSSPIFEDLVSAAGKGPMGKAKAVRMLTEMAPLLQQGKILNAKGEEVPLDFTPDVAKFMEWIEDYYDDETKVL